MPILGALIYKHLKSSLPIRAKPEAHTEMNGQRTTFEKRQLKNRDLWSENNARQVAA